MTAPIESLPARIYNALRAQGVSATITMSFGCDEVGRLRSAFDLDVVTDDAVYAYYVGFDEVDSADGIAHVAAAVVVDVLRKMGVQHG